ncbi:hypothetical protein VTJ49DRAFT_1450 [Mycothermus thermophilus]|uniref:lytic cellulose monooxygenase (C4-dehydrogenating) n=1 Tax=Humicola insolens TaxID=85995 RepID=A0ABR3VCT6_HUMIN
MRLPQAASLLALAAQVHGHGYIYRVTADNTIYPGYDIFIDPLLRPAPYRIAYGGGQTGPVYDLNSKDMACQRIHTPAPGLIAQARAGSNITFWWSRWLYSHRGPITAWMAPYEGEIEDVDVNELEFFKFGEEAHDENGVWGTEKMLDETEGKWTVKIPADIKPGLYVVRNEIIALHFAVRVPPNFAAFTPIGPQFYMTCFAFNITGDGTATPQGYKFPGAYKDDDPALHWDLELGEPYPMAGPKIYVPEYDVQLEPKPEVIISPTNNATADEEYWKAQADALAAQAATTEFFDSIGG